MKTFVNTVLAETWEVKGEGGDAAAAGRPRRDTRSAPCRAAPDAHPGVDVSPTAWRPASGPGAVAKNPGWWPATSSTAISASTKAPRQPVDLTEIRRLPSSTPGAQMLIRHRHRYRRATPTPSMPTCRPPTPRRAARRQRRQHLRTPVISKPSLIDVTLARQTAPASSCGASAPTPPKAPAVRPHAHHAGRPRLHPPAQSLDSDRRIRPDDRRAPDARGGAGQTIPALDHPGGKRRRAGDCQVSPPTPPPCYLGIQTYRDGWDRREAKIRPREPGPVQRSPKHRKTPDSQRKTVTDSYKNG